MHNIVICAIMALIINTGLWAGEAEQPQVITPPVVDIFKPVKVMQSRASIPAVGEALVMCRMPAEVFGEPFEMPYWLTRPIGADLRAKLSEEQRELYTQLYEATTAWAELQAEVDQATARGKSAVSAEQTVQQQFLKAQEKAAKAKKAMSAQERDGWFSRISNASKRREEMCQAAINKQSELRVPMSEKHMKAVALWAPVINHYRSKDKDSSVRDLLKKIKEQEATK